MPTRPIIRAASAVQASAAVEKIHARRQACDDPDLVRVGWPDPDDLLGVVRYVTRYRAVAKPVVKADLVNVMTILDHLKGEIERLQANTASSARAHGATWEDLAPGFRVNTRQGAEQAFVRMGQAVKGEPRSVVEARGMRAHSRVLEVASTQGLSIRRLVAALVNPDIGMPWDMEDHVERLWETLIELGPEDDPGVALTAGLRWLLRELHSRDDLSPQLEQLVQAGLSVIRAR